MRKIDHEGLLFVGDPDRQADCVDHPLRVCLDEDCDQVGVYSN